MGTRSTGEESPRSSAAASRDSSPRTEQCLYLLEKIKKHISYWPQFVSNDEMMWVQSRDDNEYSTTRISLDHAHHQLNFLIKKLLHYMWQTSSCFRNHKLCCILSLFSLFHFFVLYLNYLRCTWKYELRTLLSLFWWTSFVRCCGFLSLLNLCELFCTYFLAASYIIKMGENTTRMMQNN